MNRSEMIQYIRENTKPYQGMEDDFEGLDNATDNELLDIVVGLLPEVN